jgi:hypothetical protein
MASRIGPIQEYSKVLHRFVVLAPLIALAVAASACTPFKARDADRNEGGGSMYRSTDSPRAH